MPATKEDVAKWVLKAAYRGAPPHRFWRRPDGAYVAFEKISRRRNAAVHYRECEPNQRPLQTLLMGSCVYEGWVKITAEEFEAMWAKCHKAYYTPKGNIRKRFQNAK